MDIGFQGIGEWAATLMGGNLTEGHVVKMGSSGTAAACSAGDEFCGVVLKGGREACTVQLGGLATLGYTGTAPAVGYAQLEADGSGGVQTAETGGQTMLVVAVDETAETVTVKL